ncbi:MAG: CopD family protein [Chromatiales bacterium]|nr:MAG: CopD family protein [Chromatiales bacterium]
MYETLLLLHILAATVWTGGHLVLALTVLPRALKNRSTSDLIIFESGYERIGIPALLIQVATGAWLANRLVPDISEWVAVDDPVSRLVLTKLILLAITVGFAADARLRIIPRLSEETLTSLAWHIIPVTIVSVVFVVVGVSFRTGWLL